MFKNSQRFPFGKPDFHFSHTIQFHFTTLPTESLAKKSVSDSTL